jgi:guanylate kinase
MLDLERPDRGLIFVVSGPSGVGKSTLIQGLMKQVPYIDFSVSATTRAARSGEKHGVDYYFHSVEEFLALVSEGAFFEYAKVYDRYYGTLKEPTEAVLAQGRSILLDIDVQGARQIRKNVPDSVHIMVVPKTITILEKRLISRGKDSQETIARRMRQVASQLGACGEYDYLVVNDDLTSSQPCFNGIFLNELVRRSRCQSLVEHILAELSGM